MRIVNIEDFFHPDAGYQINILPKYLAKFGHEVIIITSEMDKMPKGLTSFFGSENIKKRDEDYQNKYGVRIIRLPIRRYISGRSIYTNDLKNTIDALKPDILYIHGNDTAVGMWALINRKKISIPLIMDSHMLEMASVNPFNKVFHFVYRHFFTPIIRNNNILVIRTQDDNYVEKRLGIPLSQAPWISYGSDTMLFHPNYKNRMDFRREHDISEDDFVVVYAGKLDEAKGGKLLAEAFYKRIKCNRNIVLLVVGNTSGNYGDEVEKIFENSENRILRFSTQKYCDLAIFYQAADLAVFARQCSLSFYDVQACGLPVLSENNNINVERCSHKNGWTFVAGDVEDFRRKVVSVANMDLSEYRKYSKHALNFILESYNYEDKAKEYEQCIIRTYSGLF